MVLWHYICKVFYHNYVLSEIKILTFCSPSSNALQYSRHKSVPDNMCVHHHHSSSGYEAPDCVSTPNLIGSLHESWPTPDLWPPPPVSPLALAKPRWMGAGGGGCYQIPERGPVPAGTTHDWRIRLQDDVDLSFRLPFPDRNECLQRRIWRLLRRVFDTDMHSSASGVVGGGAITAWYIPRRACAPDP